MLMIVMLFLVWCILPTAYLSIRLKEAWTNVKRQRFYVNFISSFRSESPSSQRSSPPISPGCEDQMLDSHEPFKKPLPPMRPQEFPPFYGGYPYHLMQHGSSAFHRPIDASGKPLPVKISKWISSCLLTYYYNSIRKLTTSFRSVGVHTHTHER